MSAPRVGIVGTGWGLTVQVPAFQKAGLLVTAIWARSAESAAKVKKEYPTLFVTSNFDEFLARPDIDIVSIVTPPFAHEEMALKVLKANKHLLLDKPTTLNSSESAAILKASQQHPELVSFM